MAILLTDREQQILQLIAQGCTNRQIARQLLISESTTENHIHHIYIKLRISNRAQAVAYVFRMVPTPEDQLHGNGGNPS